MRRRAALARLPLLLVALALATASGAQGSERSASWTWSVDVPGTPIAGGEVREVASAGSFVLVAGVDSGRVLVGPIVAGRPQLQPLTSTAADEPLVVYTAASESSTGQSLVGVARSDVDRVAIARADGSQTDLPLNEWRGFDYVAPAPEQAAVEVEAYSAGTSVGAVRLPQSTAASSAESSATAVYAISRTSLAAQTVRIARVDSRTLRPLGGSSVVLRGQVVGPVALSPDEQRLALVAYDAETSDSSHLLIVDLQRMRVLKTLPVPKNAIRALSWPEANRLLELRQTMGPPYNRNVRSRVAWAVDPSSGARVGSGRLTNTLAIRQSLATPAGLVLLLSTSGLSAAGESQVAVVSSNAVVRTATIPLRSIEGGRLMGRLAVDSSTNHAYVVAPGGVVFDVDLGSMTVARHEVAPPPGSAGVAPPVGIPDAEMLPGKLAIAGLFPNGNGAAAQGVVLIDVGSWTARVVDGRAGRFVTAGGRIVTYASSAGGVSVYDSDGALVAHLYSGRAVNELFVTPRFGHAVYRGPSTVTRVAKHRPPVVISNDQLAFDLQRGSAAGSGPLSSAKPPLGPPVLVFRGSPMVGESSDRQLATASARTIQIHATPKGYTISNLGRRVTPRGKTGVFFNGAKYQLFLLGTTGGRAYYRIQVTPHFRCWGSGNAADIGAVQSLGCPTVVGAYPLQQDDMAMTISTRRGKPRSTAPPTYLRIGGILADSAVKAELRDSAGHTVASVPVVQNLFSFEPPYPRTFLHVVGVDAAGKDLLPHPEWGQHQQQPVDFFGPRATKVLPSRLSQAIQHAASHGVDVTVGRNSVVVVHQASLEAATKRRISGSGAGVSCFVVSPTIRHTRSAGTSFTTDEPTMAFRILGYIKPPFDGCEISGTYGHRWRDQWGTHSPVEIPFTARGRRYFDNRAAARDLALFVRSGDMQRIRKKSGSALVAAIRAKYGHRVSILGSETDSAAPGAVGIWTSGTRTVISERSTAGGRFYVELDHGRIQKENVRGLAFVF